MEKIDIYRIKLLQKQFEHINLIKLNDKFKFKGLDFEFDEFVLASDIRTDLDKFDIYDDYIIYANTFKIEYLDLIGNIPIFVYQSKEMEIKK